MYDRRAIMDAAHRYYVAARGRAMYGVAASPMQIWRECLRFAWANAKAALFYAARQAAIRAGGEARRINDAILFEEARDTGYNAARVSRLHDELRKVA